MKKALVVAGLLFLSNTSTFAGDIEAGNVIPEYEGPTSLPMKMIGLVEHYNCWATLHIDQGRYEVRHKKKDVTIWIDKKDNLNLNDLTQLSVFCGRS